MSAPARDDHRARVRPRGLGALVLILAGCTVGPNYTRPGAAVPDAYRGTTAGDATTGGATALGEQKWWEVFQDGQLRQLIATALQQNWDVRVAAARVLQAQAQLGVARADQFPSLTGGAQVQRQRVAQAPVAPGVSFPSFETNLFDTSLSLAWELDFWGRFRRATEAARASLLASEWGRQAVLTTLVADVAGAYFQLRELDLELEISERTLRSRRESLDLVKSQEEQGAASMLDVRQSEELVFTAAAAIPDLERRIEQQENFVNILLGQNPSPVPRGRPVTAQPHPPVVPAGLPASLLERRPDIRQAEQRLVAANARIGVAKAAYFPQITLTGLGGFQSSELGSLFSGPAGMWTVAAGLTEPVFDAGRIRSTVRLAEAQQQEAVLVYQQTIQQAFREVSDGLVAYRKAREFRLQQELLTQSAQDAARLSESRYQGGATSYLEVLDSNTRYFSAELSLAQAQLGELEALVQLYRALGGGWQL
jgi:outer membrane protein, multidrug efflux system